jgi:2-dehydro-3-deoxyphosphogluconate aldolase / (4S)-4-hydroxy-2-oxoglutarate aldolase
LTADLSRPAIASETDVLDLAPVIPVVVLDAVEQAVPLAQALLRGGIPVIELTLRSPAGLGAIEAVASRVEGMVVGAGTVVTPEQVQQVKDAGAQFVVTPGSPPRLLEAALAGGLPLLAGAGTLTEMLTLAEAGLEAMKFFPAEASGGRQYLSAVSGPCPQLRFCPTGGITAETAADWLALPNVRCVGGSWLTPKDALAQADWARVERLAAEAAALRLA